jgi:hypothetical protein
MLILLALVLQAEPPHIFGLHEAGGEGHLAAMNRKGWIVFTEEVGRDPANVSGKDFRPWSDQGYGVIVRINHGYGPSQGTIPYEHHYDAFSRRAANYVAASKGARIWLIGNETNHEQEWPRYEGVEQKITAAMYARCFKLVRDRIKALPGRAGDVVVPQATAPWSARVGQGWIEYHVEVLERLGAGGFDAIAIHTYTHGSDPNLVWSESKMQAPYQNRYYQFKAYRDFMNANPAWARTLPVYVTECAQNGPWADANSGWVRNAYAEIDWWNRQAGTQKIRCLALYRWPDLDHSRIVGKIGVINDFREAMRNDYRWTTSVAGLPDVVVTSLAYSNGVFTSVVKNQGTAATPAATAIGVGYRVDGVQRTWGSVMGPLAAGASATIGTHGGSYAIPSGTHAIEAVADDINRFAESNESNNKLQQTVTVGGTALPDVVVTSLSYSNGVFACVVRNQGGAATPQGVAVGAAYLVDGVYRTWGSGMGPLAAGASMTLGTNGGGFIVPSGTHVIEAFADDVNRFAESNESNNRLSQSISVGTSAKAGVEAETEEEGGGGEGGCGALGLEAFLAFGLRKRRRRG